MSPPATSGSSRLQQAQRLGGRRGREHLGAALAEDRGHQLPGVRVVVHDQDAQAGQAGGRSATACAPRARRVRGLHGQGRGGHAPQGQRAPRTPRPCPALVVRRAHVAAVQLHQVAHDGQPQAQPAVAAGCWRSRPGGSARRRGAGTRAAMPSPVSCDRDLDVGVHASRRTWTLAAPGRELDGVGEQVPDDLLQPVGVAGDRARLGVQDRRWSADPLGLGRRAHGVQRGLDHRPRARTGLHVQAQLARDDARDVEDVRDELASGPARCGRWSPRRAGASPPGPASPARSRWAQPTMALAACAARGRAWPGTRPSAGWPPPPRPAPPAPGPAARTRSRSARLRLVMSETMRTAPAKAPFSSTMGWATSPSQRPSSSSSVRLWPQAFPSPLERPPPRRGRELGDRRGGGPPDEVLGHPAHEAGPSRVAAGHEAVRIQDADALGDRVESALPELGLPPQGRFRRLDPQQSPDRRHQHHRLHRVGEVRVGAGIQRRAPSARRWRRWP